MAILPIYTYGAPVLRKKAQPVRYIDDSLIRLIMDMFETMHKASGIGLAATQVGSLRRVIVVDLSGMEEAGESRPLALINPEILSQEGRWSIEEGCLSIPNLRDEVERAERIRVRFKDTNFQDVELEAGGLLARVILHELDHLNGVLFTDHLTTERRKLHSDDLRQIQRGDAEVEYPVITAADVAA